MNQDTTTSLPTFTPPSFEQILSMQWSDDDGIAPADDYYVKIVKVELGTSRAGAPMYVVTLGFDDEPTYKPFKTWLLLPTQAEPWRAGKIQAFAKMFNATNARTINDLVGLGAYAKVLREEYKGTDGKVRVSNRIKI